MPLKITIQRGNRTPTIVTLSDEPSEAWKNARRAERGMSMRARKSQSPVQDPPGRADSRSDTDRALDIIADAANAHVGYYGTLKPIVVRERGRTFTFSHEPDEE
jgi:hypothetical protein